jgi:hypothetical protein
MMLKILKKNNYFLFNLKKHILCAYKLEIVDEIIKIV